MPHTVVRSQAHTWAMLIAALALLLTCLQPVRGDADHGPPSTPTAGDLQVGIEARSFAGLGITFEPVLIVVTVTNLTDKSLMLRSDDKAFLLSVTDPHGNMFIPSPPPPEPVRFPGGAYATLSLKPREVAPPKAFLLDRVHAIAMPGKHLIQLQVQGEPPLGGPRPIIAQCQTEYTARAGTDAEYEWLGSLLAQMIISNVDVPQPAQPQVRWDVADPVGCWVTSAPLRYDLLLYFAHEQALPHLLQFAVMDFDERVDYLGAIRRHGTPRARQMLELLKQSHDARLAEKAAAELAKMPPQEEQP